MLSVPWFVGWALRPYIQINVPVEAAAKADAAVTEKTLKQEVTASDTPLQSSSTSPNTAKPVSTEKGGNQEQPEPLQQTPLAKSSATRTSVPVTTTPVTAKLGVQQPTPTPIAVIQAQLHQQQSAPPHSEAKTKVSSAKLELKMSAEWYKQQLEKYKFDFDDADRDKSGYLSFEEVVSVLEKEGFKGSQEEAKKLFSHLDVNQDLKISRTEFLLAVDEVPRCVLKVFVLRKAFKALDKDGSGTLTRSEIENATKGEIGLDLPAGKIAELLIILSKENKDHLDYEEFLQVFGVHLASIVMQEVFSKLDTDHSGFLTKEEILDAVKAERELKLHADKIADLLIYWCKDQDKKIHYEEFVQVWKSGK